MPSSRIRILVVGCMTSFTTAAGGTGSGSPRVPTAAGPVSMLIPSRLPCLTYADAAARPNVTGLPRGPGHVPARGAVLTSDGPSREAGPPQQSREDRPGLAVFTSCFLNYADTGLDVPAAGTV